MSPKDYALEINPKQQREQQKQVLNVANYVLIQTLYHKQIT